MKYPIIIISLLLAVNGWSGYGGGGSVIYVGTTPGSSRSVADQDTAFDWVLDGDPLPDGQFWDDIRGSLIGQRLNSTAGKVDYDYTEVAINMQPGGSISTANDLLIWTWQKPHAMVDGGEFRVHIHWQQVSTDNIEFTMQYRIQDNNATKTESWTEVSSGSSTNSAFTYPGSGTFNQITKIGSIDTTGTGISATLQFRLARTDSTSDDILATFVDAHIPRNQIGSRQEFVK